MIRYNDSVYIYLPTINDDGSFNKDDYGKIERKSHKTIAHVRYNIESLYDERGEGFNSTAQVYIPFTEKTRGFDDNSRITHINPNGTEQTTSVKKLEYGQDVAGVTHFIKVYL